jgi:hypothetical protein
MTRTPARLGLPLLAFLLAIPLASCKLPYEILVKLVGPKRATTPTPIPAQPIEAVFAQINDERVRGDSESSTCNLTVDLPGTKGTQVAATRVVTRKAVDDLGNDLVPEKAAEAQFASFDPGNASNADELPAYVWVPVRNAPRKAKLLKEVTADAELYAPGLDPAALVTVPRFLGEAGKPFVSPALQAAGVEIALLSKEQVEAERKAYAERRREEAKKMGVTGEMLDTTVRLAAESFLSSEWVKAWLKVKDPKSAVFDYVFLNPAGEAQGVNLSAEEGFVGLSAQGEEPGPDWGLQVRLKTPKTFQRYTFTLKDVPLP